MQNFDTAVSATTTAFNSQGSAMTENAKAMESLESQTNLLKAEWEDFSNNVVSSGFVSFILQMAEGGLKVLNTDLGQTAVQVTAVSAAVLGLSAIVIPLINTISAMAKTNPLILALSAIAGAVTLVTTVIVDVVQAHKALVQEATNLTEAMEDANQTFEDSEITIHASAELAEEYIGTIEELTSKEKLTEQEQYNLQRTISELNSLYPNLGVEVDSATGKLNMQVETIRELVAQYKELALQQAITTKLESQASAIAEAQLNLKELEYGYSQSTAKQALEMMSQLSVFQQYPRSEEEMLNTLAGIWNYISEDNLSEWLPIKQLFGSQSEAYQQLDAYRDYIKSKTALEQALAEANATYDEMVAAYSDVYGTSTGATTGGVTTDATGTTTTAVTGLTETEIEARKTAFENAQKFYQAKYKLGEMTEEEYYNRMYGLAEYYYKGQSQLLTEWADEYDTYTKWKAKKDAAATEAQEQADADALQAKKDAYNADLQALQEYYEDGGYGEYGTDVAESRYRAAVYERAKQAFAEGVIDEHDFHDAEFSYNQYLKMLSDDMKEAAQKAQEEAAEARIKEAKEGYAEEKRLLDNQLATYEITEEEYYERLFQLAVKYYKDKEGLEEEWQGAQDDYAEWSADQAFKSAKENYANDAKALKEQLENNEITEAEYYAKLKELAKIYFGALPGYAEYCQSVLDDILEDEQEAIDEATEKAKKETIEDAKSTYNQLLDFIDKQIDAQEALLKVNEEAQKAIDEKYDKQLEDLKATNEALEDEIEYQELLNNLAKAKSEKVMVWKDGRFQQVEDYQAVADATAKLAEADRQRALAAEEAEIEANREAELAPLITDAKTIQAGIDKWEAYKDTLDEVAISVDNLADATLALDLATSFASTTTDEERQAVVDRYVSAYNLAHPTSSIFDNATGYASGTINSTSGLHLFGERGAELGVLGAHNGVLPADITANLWDWGSMAPSSLLSALAGEGGGMSVSIGSAQFPNVHNGADAEGFITSLRNLAYQAARSRVRS